MRSITRASGCLLVLLGMALLGPTPGLRAQEKLPAAPPRADLGPILKDQALANKLHSPVDARPPVFQRLRSPREMLKSFYYAVATFDLYPQMIDEAADCLDLGSMPPISPEETSFLVLELDRILQGLDLPIKSVADNSLAEKVTLYDSDGFKISARRCPDNCWRIDAESLERIPTMRRVAGERRKSVPAELAQMKENATDPRTTMRKFMGACIAGDYYTASYSLDLSSLSSEQRRQRGPVLAQQLAVVIQRHSYVFAQEIPDKVQGAPYTWWADRAGRITLDRQRLPDGKEAWLFTRQTVSNIPRMYEACLASTTDAGYVRLGLIVPLVAATPAAAAKRPENVPAALASPQAVLRGFFRAMDEAEINDGKLAEGIIFLDLQSLPPAERGPFAAKLMPKLEAVLRKSQIDLNSISDDWNAPLQKIGDDQGLSIEIQRQRDGCWRFNEASLNRVPAMFDKLAGRDRSDRERTSQLESARDTMVHFLTAVKNRDYTRAAECLDLSALSPRAQDELGPILAYKLRYILDRLGRIYVQEVPDEPDGPRYLVHRTEMGRIVLSRRTEDPGKGQWLFAPSTVARIEPMFRELLDAPVTDAAAADDATPRFAEAPGIWLRLRLPVWAERRVGPLELYQWLGLALAGSLSWSIAYLCLSQLHGIVGWLLRKSGSNLTTKFVSEKLRPLTWIAAITLLTQVIDVLDLPVAVGNTMLPLKKFLITGMIAWLALRIIDLVMAIYMNSELLKPHRSLSDMVVPVSMRLVKGAVLIVTVAYFIYEIGQGDLLGRFITGLGVAGLAVSLAAQDALKSFFSTLLLIGERSFKIGDRIIIGSQEGVVEQVGFRSTRLRTKEDSVLTMPNSVIASAAIDNMGARSQRRLTTSFLVHPQTPLPLLIDLRDHLRAWLHEQPNVNPQKVDVHIHRIIDAGVELTLTLYLTTLDGVEETACRESIHCQLLALADQMGVVLASTQQPLPAEAVALYQGMNRKSA
jgi:MscS family membrane protein